MKQAIGVVVCVIDPPFQNSFGLISIHFMNHHTSAQYLVAINQAIFIGAGGQALIVSSL
jgi:hypothetical protein